MKSDAAVWPFALSGVAMMLIAVAAVVCWQRMALVQTRCFWIGAILWTIAVALKIGCAIATNAAVLGWLKRVIPGPWFIGVGGLFVGVQSSLCEIGLTLLAVLIWRHLGRDGPRAIAIAIGAGAFEAFVLGLAQTASVAVSLSGAPGTAEIGESLRSQAALTPLLWLAAPIERIIAIIVHAATRALVLLGATHRPPALVIWGFVIFTLLDGVAGTAHVSGKLDSMWMWWIELAVLPFAIVSLAILRWCARRWPAPAEQ